VRRAATTITAATAAAAVAVVATNPSKTNPMASSNFHCHMACLVTMEHLAVMDATEPKETRAARERLGPRDHPVQTEQRESLELRAPPAKKDSEERKARMELQDHLSSTRT